MAATISSMFQALSPRKIHSVNSTACQARASNRPRPTAADLSNKNRRQMLFLFTATAAVAGTVTPSMAEDIGLFGVRRNLRKAEEKAEEIVREGFEAAEKGIETAERGIVTAEKKIQAAERGIESAEMEIETAAVGFGGLSQAGVVAGAEVVGVLIATSIVNGILGPEGKKA